MAESNLTPSISEQVKKALKDNMFMNGGKYVDCASHKKDSIINGHVTHWMPLPPAPVTEK